MVLWEITLTTAYFLGLKRTYRLALKLQRLLIGPHHPQIRQFLHRNLHFPIQIHFYEDLVLRNSGKEASLAVMRGESLALPWSLSLEETSLPLPAVYRIVGISKVFLSIATLFLSQHSTEILCLSVRFSPPALSNLRRLERWVSVSRSQAEIWNESFGIFPVQVMFICNHCPFVKHLKKDIVKLANFYMKKGLAVVAISSNSVVTHPQDGPEFMAEEAKLFEYPFPYLYDESHLYSLRKGSKPWILLISLVHLKLCLRTRKEKKLKLPLLEW
ncbi:hypothetical protein NE237_014225 [Protea cynaroides]|uniref:Thioredoxin-dependent peroxiredoxin n=1 Tax=Protea cynaroides TaxID=273540 RepID=A0A9Q0JRX6_9MAGN|nr:hypothetical protein NE237_014225 [Protea cynaroides]